MARILRTPYWIYDQKLKEHLGHKEIPIGIEFEVIARTVLKRLAFDCNLDFSVINADVHQDVEQMSDFFIRRKGSSKLIAVQFTTSQSQALIDSRTQRAERIMSRHPELEKVIVVPMKFIEHPQRLLKKWTDNPDPKTHPLQYIPAEFQERVCDSILKLALPEDEYNSSMSKIRISLGTWRAEKALE